MIGGYSSHGWHPDQKGDATSFLFNLTENLKFTTISRVYMQEESEQECYTWLELKEMNSNLDESYDSQDASFQDQRTAKYQLQFGQKELVIKHDFEAVSSDLINSYYYTLFGD